MEEITLLLQQKDAPREDCQACQQSGKVRCPDCGGNGFTDCPQCKGDGKGYGGIGGECPCQYSNEAQTKLRCQTCNASGKVNCKCVFAIRFVWEDDKCILGHKTTIQMMAEQAYHGPWIFHTRENSGMPWCGMPATDQATNRVDQILAMIDVNNQALRERLHTLVNGLPNEAEVLTKVIKTLEGL